MSRDIYVNLAVPTVCDHESVCQDCGAAFPRGLLALHHATDTGHDVKSVQVTHYFGSLGSLKASHADLGQAA